MLGLRKRLNLLNLALWADEIEERLVKDYEVGVLSFGKAIGEIAIGCLDIVDGVGCGLTSVLHSTTLFSA